VPLLAIAVERARVVGHRERPEGGSRYPFHAVYQSIDDPNDVTVWHDFEDAGSAKAFAQSEELREAMGRAGVAGEPTIWFTEPT
jgi:hypothetical protein